MRRPAPSLLAALLALPAAAPAVASACGGLFCSSAIPIPVEQTGERILFEVDDKGVVATTVEIAYSGDPLGFAWVVPVGTTAPVLEVVPPDALAALDALTAPTIFGQRTTCGQAGFLGCDASAPGIAGALRLTGAVARAAAVPVGALLGCPATYDDDDWVDGVWVESLPRVGPYEPTFVASDDATALASWLTANGYVVTSAMAPYIGAYVASGIGFLAMKLAPEATVSDIAPIRMAWPARGTPTIPLVLTAVAAEPEMEITAFVAASTRFRAENYANLLVDPSWIRLDPVEGVSNYKAVVAWLSDRVGGSAFFTQYAGVVPRATASATGFDGDDDDDDTAAFPEEVDAFLAALAGRHARLTRLYARLSPWEMQVDPLFVPSDGGDVFATISLAGNRPVDVCRDDLSLGVCGDTYCGADALCARTELGPSCVCPDGFAARLVTPRRPGGPPEVACQRLDHDVLVGDDAPDLGDPCAGVDCGLGTCVAVGGIPTCACDEGAAAGSQWGDASPTCVAMEGSPLLPEDALVGGDLGTAFAATEARRSTAASSAVLAALLAGAAVRLRRRGPTAA